MKPLHPSAGHLATLCLIASLPAQAGFWDNIKEQADKARGAIESLDDAASQAGKRLGLGDQDEEQERQEQTEAPSPQPALHVTPSQPVQPAAPSSPRYDRAQVLTIQKNLNALGYNVGAADGLYGPGTRRGIEAFQRDRGMPVDGKPSPAMQAKLDNAVRMAHSKPAPVTTVGTNDAASSPIASLADKNDEIAVSPASQTAQDIESGLPDAESVDIMLTIARLRPDLLDKTHIGNSQMDMLAHFLRRYPQWFDLDRDQAYKLIENEFEYPRRRQELKKIVLEHINNAPIRFIKQQQVGLADYDFDRKFYPFQQSLKVASGPGPDYVYFYVHDEAELKGLPLSPEKAERLHKRQTTNFMSLGVQMRKEGRTPSQGDFAGGDGVEVTWSYTVKSVKYSTEVTKPKLRPGTWVFEIEPDTIAVSETWWEFNGIKNSMGRYERTRKQQAIADFGYSDLLEQDQKTKAASFISPVEKLERRDEVSQFAIKKAALGMSPGEFSDLFPSDDWHIRTTTPYEGRLFRAHEIMVSKGGNFILNARFTARDGELYKLSLTQIFPKNAHFDTDAIKQQIINRYGQPDELHDHGNGVTMSYHEIKGAPNSNVVARDCAREFRKREHKQTNTNLISHQIQMEEWVKNGDGMIREYCPDTLLSFKAYLEGQFGARLSVTADPKRKSVRMALDSRRLMYQSQREKNKQTASQPTVELEL